MSTRRVMTSWGLAIGLTLIPALSLHGQTDVIGHGVELELLRGATTLRITSLSDKPIDGIMFEITGPNRQTVLQTRFDPYTTARPLLAPNEVLTLDSGIPTYLQTNVGIGQISTLYTDGTGYGSRIEYLRKYMEMRRAISREEVVEVSEYPTDGNFLPLAEPFIRKQYKLLTNEPVSRYVQLPPNPPKYPPPPPYPYIVPGTWTAQGISSQLGIPYIYPPKPDSKGNAQCLIPLLTSPVMVDCYATGQCPLVNAYNPKKQSIYVSAGFISTCAPIYESSAQAYPVYSTLGSTNILSGFAEADMWLGSGIIGTMTEQDSCAIANPIIAIDPPGGTGVCPIGPY